MESKRIDLTRNAKAALCGLFLSVLVLPGSTAAEEGVHWTYAGEHGPEHWGELSEAFATCSTGRNQSPIDIVDPVDAALGAIGIDYPGSAIAVVNNGHTLQVNVGSGNSLAIGGQTFALLQFHLHTPSEHRIQGESFAMEAHFVHRNDRGELAVVAVLFREGPANSGIAAIEASAPVKPGASQPIDTRISDLAVMPEGRAYYRYSGSLTTPPCTEGVVWLVLHSVASVSAEQVATFEKLIGEDDRGPQPLNGRLVVY